MPPMIPQLPNHTPALMKPIQKCFPSSVNADQKQAKTDQNYPNHPKPNEPSSKAIALHRPA